MTEEAANTLERRGSKTAWRVTVFGWEPHFGILNSSRVPPLGISIFGSVFIRFYLFLIFCSKVPFNFDLIADPSRALATFDAMKLLPHYSPLSWQNAYDVNFNEDRS